MTQAPVAPANLNQQNALPPSEALMQMLDGHYLSQAIFVAAKLGIADLLKDGTKSTDELAKVTEVNSQFLYRILRALSSVGIFAEVGDRNFELTPLAKYLQSDVPGSMRLPAILVGEEWHWQAWGNMFNAVKNGTSAFEAKFGTNIVDYFGQNPQQSKVFFEAMTTYSVIVNNAILEVYDFSAFSKLVDVGGGLGSLLTDILKANPQLTGILLELPPVIERAKQQNHFQTKEISGRYEIVGGDFLESVPSGGDVYILKQIIHNLNNDDAIKLLQNCHDAMSTNGKLLVIDPVIPSSNEPSFSKLLDLQMMVTHGAQVHTANEFQDILTKTGFQITNIIPTKSPCTIIESVKK
uniref:Tjp4 n=1 Tax=Symphyonema bifilamentata 97.28 TaxID=2721247 RepID=A0A6H0DZM5_9CYAN|nr:Tjp4 [Symphyonema bifilamentata 97.28]